ncbi:MAG: peptidoglycan-associated lipoprotein Pal [Alphaproteobacteria bacterium]
MNWKILVAMLGGLALAACETTPDDTGSAKGGGSGSDGASSAAPSVSSSTLASRTPAGARAGSQEDLVVNVGDRVFFALDSHQLQPDARATLEKQAQWLRQNPAVTVAVEGHADERGTRDYNLALGERRATAVRDYLVALGITANRMRTVSFGKERPVDPQSNEEAWLKNRRGVMVVN